MANVQFGSIVTDLKGKVQGQVFQGGNVGSVLRNKGYTKGIPSSSRQAATGKLSTITALWRSLTSVQMAAWAAISDGWTFVNKFGVTYQGSAFQIFTSYNTQLLSIGEAAQTTPHVVEVPTTMTSPLIAVSTNAGVYTDIDVQFGNNGATNDVIAVFASAPRSAGKNTNHVRFKKIFTASLNGVNEVDNDTIYQNLWGVAPIGSTVVVKIIIYDKRYPRPTQQLITSTVVVSV